MPNGVAFPTRRAHEGAPNFLFIVLDDPGFEQLGCFGSPTRTPNFHQKVLLLSVSW